MSVVTRRPGGFGEFAELRERFDRIFEDMFDREPGTRRPALDVVREDDGLVLQVEVPEMGADEVSVEVQDGVLTIRGRHEDRTEEQDARLVRRERRVGAFARSVPLPPGVDAEAITATCEHGVLEVRLPESRRSEPRAIEVQAKG